MRFHITVAMFRFFKLTSFFWSELKFSTFTQFWISTHTLYKQDVILVTYLLRLKAHVIQSALEEQWGRFSENLSFQVAGVLEENNQSALTQGSETAFMVSF